MLANFKNAYLLTELKVKISLSGKKFVFKRSANWQTSDHAKATNQ